MVHVCLQWHIHVIVHFGTDMSFVCPSWVNVLCIGIEVVLQLHIIVHFGITIKFHKFAAHAHKDAFINETFIPT